MSRGPGGWCLPSKVCLPVGCLPGGCLIREGVCLGAGGVHLPLCGQTDSCKKATTIADGNFHFKCRFTLKINFLVSIKILLENRIFPTRKAICNCLSIGGFKGLGSGGG